MPCLASARAVSTTCSHGTTCRVTTLNGAHDPMFGGINPEPIAKNYGRSSAYLQEASA